MMNQDYCCDGALGANMNVYSSFTAIVECACGQCATQCPNTCSSKGTQADGADTTCNACLMSSCGAQYNTCKMN
jgi:hypothetical protein